MATFGNTGTGGSDYTSTYVNRGYVCKFTLSENGDVSKLTFRGNASSSMNVKGLIYNDNAGVPGTRNAVSNPTAVNSTLGQWDLTFAAPVSLAAGVYWLGVVTDEAASGQFRADYSVGNGNIWRNSSLGYASPADPFGGAQESVDHIGQIYATYTAAGGGGNPWNYYAQQ